MESAALALTGCSHVRATSSDDDDSHDSHDSHDDDDDSHDDDDDSDDDRYGVEMVRRTRPIVAPARSVRVAIVTSLLGLLALLLLVASSGTVPVWHDPPPGKPSAIVPTDDTVPTGDAFTPGSLLPDESSGNGFLSIAVVTLLVLLVVVVAVTLLATFFSVLGRRPQAHPSHRTPMPAPLPALDPATFVVNAAAHERALAGGSPRNAIVACWLALEEDVAAAGLPRHPAETSAEYTARVLTERSLEPGPIGELADLFREARFSRHELGQLDRERAFEALRHVHAGLETRSTPAESVAAGSPEWA